MEFVPILQCVSNSCCSLALTFPWTHIHTRTVRLSLNSRSRGGTQTWEACCAAALGRVLVEWCILCPVSGEGCAWRWRSAETRRAVWHRQGAAAAALPWGGRACSCRGSLGTAWAVHRVGCAVVAVCVWGSVCVCVCVCMCVSVSASPFHNGSVII